MSWFGWSRGLVRFIETGGSQVEVPARRASSGVHLCLSMSLVWGWLGTLVVVVSAIDVQGSGPVDGLAPTGLAMIGGATWSVVSAISSQRGERWARISLPTAFAGWLVTSLVAAIRLSSQALGLAGLLALNSVACVFVLRYVAVGSTRPEGGQKGPHDRDGTMPLPQPRRHLVLTSLGVTAVVVAIVVRMVGLWNPLNMVYVTSPVTGPYVAVVLCGGLGLLWFLHVNTWELRIGAAVGVGLVLVLYAFFAALISEPTWRDRTASPHGDVHVELVSSSQTWDVWLGADRGWLSRESHLTRIGTGDSAPPSVEARFTGPNQVEVWDEADGTVAYRARFDPGDLDVLTEDCVPDSGQHEVGCVRGHE
jgi:hypothetical protein